MSGMLGHVDQMPLPDITDYLKRTVEAFSVRNRKGCGTCDLRNLCGGSCRVEDEKTTGSRLITTCTGEDKLRKKRFLVRRYDPARASDRAAEPASVD